MNLSHAWMLLLPWLVACSRETPPPQTHSPLPTTCRQAEFRKATGEFADIAAQRDAAVAAIEALPPDEPAHYLKRLEQEQGAVQALVSRAEAVTIPRCLGHAKELFVLYVEQSRKTIDMRRPGQDFSAYRLARDTAEGIRTQYDAEVRLQEKNQQ